MLLVSSSPLKICRGKKPSLLYTDTLSAGCRLLKIKFHQLKEHNYEAHDMGYSHAGIAALLISCSFSVYILFSLIFSLNHINDSETVCLTNSHGHYPSGPLLTPWYCFLIFKLNFIGT